MMPVPRVSPDPKTEQEWLDLFSDVSERVKSMCAVMKIYPEETEQMEYRPELTARFGVVPTLLLHRITYPFVKPKSS
jgi:hypothetical protein